MRTEGALVLLFGALVIAASFVLVSFGRVVLAEIAAIRRGEREVRGNGYLGFTSFLLLICTGLVGLGVLRTLDGLMGLSIGGRTPMVLCLFVGILLAGTIGFHRAAMVSRKRKLLWYAFLGVEALWLAAYPIFLG